MSGLWSGRPNTIKLHELGVICAVLGSGVEELLTPELEQVPEAHAGENAQAPASGQRPATPRPRAGRSLPPR